MEMKKCLTFTYHKTQKALKDEFELCLKLNLTVCK